MRRVTKDWGGWQLFRKAGTVLVLMLTLAAGFAAAQVATGDVLGRVTDPTGAVVPGAVVKLENAGTHETRQFMTKGGGEFTFSALQPGTYVLTIDQPGFKGFRETNIIVAGGDRVRLDEALSPGAVSEQVEVTATPTALQTDSTSVGNTIPERALTETPLSGRNYLALVQVQPGVNQGSPNSLSGGGRVSDRRQTSSISANGQNEFFNNALIDGLDNNNRYIGLVNLRPSVDAIEEVRTDINLYTADEGRSVGAVINVITKSGTNQFHGSLYEFFRNDKTDARNYFLPTTLRKSELRQNQYGASLGGPIFRDKTFFFVDYEGLRRIDATQAVYTSTVPTAFEHANPGNLTDISPTTPIIPAASLDPTALGYLSLYPLPTAGPSVFVNNFVYNPSAVLNQSLGDARLDHHFNGKNTLFGRYSYNSTSASTPAYYPSVNGVTASGVTANPAPGNSQLQTHNGQFGYTHIFTPSLLVELKTGYTYLNSVATPFNFGSNLNDAAPFRIPNANECIYCSGLASISITGYNQVGDPLNQPSLESESTHQYLGDVIYTLGHHNLKAGGSFITRNVSIIQQVAGKGTVNFTGATSLAAITNFLKGAPYVYNRQAQLVKPYIRSKEPSFFLQDDWSATSKLKFKPGVALRNLYGAERKVRQQRELEPDDVQPGCGSDGQRADGPP